MVVEVAPFTLHCSVADCPAATVDGVAVKDRIDGGCTVGVLPCHVRWATDQPVYSEYSTVIACSPCDRVCCKEYCVAAWFDQRSKTRAPSIYSLMPSEVNIENVYVPCAKVNCPCQRAEKA